MSDTLHHAVRIATDAHSGQSRKYIDVPYLAHPLSVMMRVREVTEDVTSLAVAILHDVVEDGPGEPEPWIDRIAEECGDDVMSGVLWLSDNIDSVAGNRATRKAHICSKLRAAPPWVQTIKVADLIDNTSSIVEHDPDFARVYMREKRDLIEVLTRADERLVKQVWANIEDYELGERVRAAG